MFHAFTALIYSLDTIFEMHGGNHGESDAVRSLQSIASTVRSSLRDSRPGSSAGHVGQHQPSTVSEEKQTCSSTKMLPRYVAVYSGPGLIGPPVGSLIKGVEQNSVQLGPSRIDFGSLKLSRMKSDRFNHGGNRAHHGPLGLANHKAGGGQVPVL